MSATAADRRTALSRLKRERIAVLKVDVVESVRLSDDERDEVQVAQRWRRFVAQAGERLLAPLGGRIVHREGDGMLIAVASTVDAAQLARGLHRLLPEFNVGAPQHTQMHLRIGLHAGRVLRDEHDLYGRSVNLAARLKDLARPGETVCSAQAREELVDGLDAQFEDLGECHLKHVRTPVRAYRLSDPAAPAGGIGAPRTPLPPPDANELRITLAVLPFETQAGGPAEAAIGNLVADVLNAALSRGAHLRVISRLSTASLRGRRMATPEVGRLLGAAYLLSGTVVISGEQITLVAELAETAGGEAVWGDSLRGKVGDLLATDGPLVSRLSTSICNAILHQELRRVRTLALPNLAAYSLLLAGITLMHRFSRSDFARAQVCLETLIERAPRHAEPYAWLARWHVFRAVQGWTDDPRQEALRALALCGRARDLDPDSSIALTVEGSVRVRIDKDLDGAMQLYHDALRANPNEPLAELLLGTAHTFKGNGEQAVQHTQRAVALTPLDPLRFFYDSHGAGAELTAGHLERAIELALRSLRANRLHHSTLRILGIAQSLSGQMDEARETVRRILEHEPALTVDRFLQQSPGGAFQHARRFAEALQRAGLPSGGNR